MSQSVLYAKFCSRQKGLCQNKKSIVNILYDNIKDVVQVFANTHPTVYSSMAKHVTNSTAKFPRCFCDAKQSSARTES